MGIPPEAGVEAASPDSGYPLDDPRWLGVHKAIPRDNWTVKAEGGGPPVNINIGREEVGV